MRKILIGLAFLAATGASAQIFNCTTFTSSGTCGVSLIGGGGQPFAIVGTANGSSPGLSSGAINLIPTGGVHTALSVNYQTFVNVQSFSSTFTFVPNGWNIALVLNNNLNSSGNGNGTANGAKIFAAGAGCEGGFYQAFNGTPPNNVLALMLDSNNWNTLSGGAYTYSSAQIYQMTQSPCNPNDSQPSYWNTDKISTSPVPLSSPVNSQGTTTGDTYSATLTYDGTTLTLNLFDVTAGGSCPGASCFTQSWANINIPSLVKGNTAVVGLVGGTNGASSSPLLIKSFSYTVNSPPTNQSFSTYTSQANSGNSPAAAPTFSPVAGSYGSAQSVTINCSTPGAYACYVLSGTFPAFLPQCDNLGGATEGTVYTTPVTVSSTETLYAMCATNRTRLPSDLSHGLFTISGTPTATQPVFSPGTGTYTGSQTVLATNPSTAPTGCTTVDGSTPVTNGTTGCTHGTLWAGSIPITVSETLKMVWGGTGFLDSPVTTAAYTINPPASATNLAGTVIGGKF